MIGLVESDGGVILPIKAQPGAKRNAILGERAGSIRVAVTAAPEAGKANEAIAKVLAQTLGLRLSQVRLVSGASSREKRFRIEGIGALELAERLDVGEEGRSVR